MRVGIQNRWWNRPIPGKPLLLTVVLLIGTAYFWIYWGDATNALGWDVVHRRTATFRGQTLKLPWLWKEETWTNYNEFRVTKYAPGLLKPSITVQFGRFDPSVMHDDWIKIKDQPGLANWIAEDYQGDDFTQAHYKCVRIGFGHSQVTMVDCFSLDGRWAVHLIGRSEVYPELHQILRGVAAMGDPAH